MRHIIFEILKNLVVQQSFKYAKQNCQGCKYYSDNVDNHFSGCFKWYEDQVAIYLDENVRLIDEDQLKQICIDVLTKLKLQLHDVDYYIQSGLQDMSASFISYQVNEWDDSWMSLLNQAVGVVQSVTSKPSSSDHE